MRRVFVVLLLVCLCGCLAVPFVHADITSDLVVYLKLDDGAGVTASDSSAFNNDGSLSGCSWVTTAKFSGGLLFEAASTDFVDVGDDSSIRLVNELTYACWLKTGGTGDVMDRWESGKEATMLRIEGSGAVGFYINTAGGIKSVTSSGVVDDDVWHHVVGVYDGTTLKVYVDGDLDCMPTAYAGTVVVSDSDLRLGYGWSAAYFDGTLDEVRVYGRALGSGEVSDLFNYSPVASSGVKSFSDDFIVLWVVLIFIVINFFMMVLPLPWLPRFVFGVLSLMVCGVALGTTIVMQPYIQVTGCMMSVLCMLVAAVKGRS